MISQALLGIGGRDGIAIGLKLDNTGFADGGQEDPIRAVGDRWKVRLSVSSFNASKGVFRVERWIL